MRPLDSRLGRVAWRLRHRVQSVPGTLIAIVAAMLCALLATQLTLIR